MVGGVRIAIAAASDGDVERVAALLRGAFPEAAEVRGASFLELPVGGGDDVDALVLVAGRSEDERAAALRALDARATPPTQALVLALEAPDEELVAAGRRRGAMLALLPFGAEALADVVRASVRLARERAAHARTLAFEHGQRDLLEKIAGGVPLGEVLEGIVRLIERQSAAMRCSILLLDPATRQVRHGAAPSLPPEIVSAFDGQAIGPSAGSCGTAAYLGEPVVVEDIATHPYWERYRAPVLAAGLRACWSTPICSGGGEVLGTFAMYYDEPRRPADEELRWVGVATHLAAVAVGRDRAERERAASDARYRRIVDTAHEGVWELDREGRTTFVNDRMAEMLGTSPEAVAGTHLFEWIFEEDRERAEAQLGERRSGRREQHDFRFRRADGSPFWAIVAASPVRDTKGAVVGALGLCTDISERKRAERALERSESELRAIFTNAPLGMAMVDVDGRATKVNRALEALVGEAADRIEGRALAGLHHERDDGHASRLLAALLAGERDSYRVETWFANGETATPAIETGTLVRARDGAPAFAIIMAEDLTTQRAMEHSVREADRALRLAYSGATDSIFTLAVEPEQRYRFVAINPAFTATTGLSEEQVVGQLLEDVVASASPKPIRDNFTRVVSERRSLRWEEAVDFPTGRRYGEVSVTPVFDESGNATHLVAAVRDVTDRVEAQQRVAAQAALLDEARDAIVLLGLDDEVRYWNRGAARLYGIPAEEAIGRKFHELVPSDTSDVADAAVPQPGTYAKSLELTQRTRAGERIVVESSATLVTDDEGHPSGVLVINTDITEKRALEAKFLQAQRLESLGTLAGGIAHDFNNILTAIIGHARLATVLDARARRETSPYPDERAREALVEIERAAWRAADLVRSILTFSRHHEPRPVVTPLRPIVEEALTLLRATVPAKVEIRSRFADDVPDVSADPTQVHQAVMNLATNAVQAMADRGGVLDVAVDTVALDSPRVLASSELVPGRYVRLMVRDTGAGMDARTLERAFEPFFTTKGPGQGTGLGLSVVHGVMRTHGGAVDVRSEVGRGTTFYLYFRASSARAEQDAGEPIGAGYGTGERILFVDDESAITALAREGLTGLGYAVHALTDGNAAIEAVRSAPSSFDALVTDLDMPGVDGLELARRVRDLSPAITIVFITGNARPGDLAVAERLGVADVLFKPVTLERIAHVLRAHLPRAGESAAE